ncbi:MAG: glycosyltransferase family 39 protein [Deltaproteobacteria bacterium]|nr:glycosyltransferase family 39 protein [Deltaproteobacteria bacterium]
MLEVIFKSGLIIGGLSLLLFLFGHAGLLSPPYMVLAVAVFIVSLWFFLKEDFRKRARIEGYSTKDLCLMAFAVVFVLSILPLALAPPSVRDELIHHLAVPKLYIEKGRIFAIPFMGFSYYPMNIDLLYLIPLALGNDIAPRLIHFGFGLLTGLAIYAYLKAGVNRTYALLGFLVFVSTPVVINLSRIAYIDLGVTFFITLSLIGVLKWNEDGGKRWFFYSAAAAGFAIGSKPNALISLFLVTLLLVYLSGKKKEMKARACVAGAVYSLLAVSVFAPWLLRNYLWTGSPLYPLLKSFTAAAVKGEGLHIGEGLPPVMKRYLLYNESAVKILLAPFRIFFEGRDNSIEKFDGVLNPVFLFLVPLAFLRVRGLKDLKYLAAFSVMFFYIAFFTADLVIRYILPVLPPLVISSAWGVKCGMERRGLRAVTVLSLVLLFSFNIVYLGGLYKNYRTLLYLSGKETRDGYLSRVLPDYSVTKYANENLPQSAKVLFLFSGDRGYYWQREYYYGDRFGGNLIRMVKNSRTEDELKERFAGGGATHLFMMDALFGKFVMDNFSLDEKRLLSGFFKTHLVRLYGANGFSLYEII